MESYGKNHKTTNKKDVLDLNAYKTYSPLPFLKESVNIGNSHLETGRDKIMGVGNNYVCLCATRFHHIAVK